MKFSQAKGRVPTVQGRTEKNREKRKNRENGKTNPSHCVRENTGNSEILPKHRETQGFFFLENIGNFLILKIKDIAIFATKSPNFS